VRRDLTTLSVSLDKKSSEKLDDSLQVSLYLSLIFLDEDEQNGFLIDQESFQ
jgi:hypothetical protein